MPRNLVHEHGAAARCLAPKKKLCVLNRVHRYVRKRLPVRMGAWVLLGVALLFVAALSVMFRYSHQAVEKESLEKARQMLDGTVLYIDNVMHEVEVASINMCWNVEHHVDEPDKMANYCLQFLKDNPNVIGCEIAFEPNYYKGEDEFFMTYAYRDEGEILMTKDPTVLEPNVYGTVPYVAVTWYFVPIRENTMCWVRPHAPNDTLLSSVVTCSTPIHDKTGRPVGVFAADISVAEMSNRVLSTKPFPNSYCAMLGVQGTYLVHPDSTRLYHKLVHDVVKESSDKRVKDLVDAMLAGKTGCSSVTLNGEDCYVLFEGMNKGHWSACIVCPESDILAGNDRLKAYMIVITMVGLLLILAFCLLFVTHQLQPLNMLAKLAQRIARGDFSEPIPPTDRKDEIGHLQESFRVMRRSLAQNREEVHKASDELRKHNEELREANVQIQEVDRMKTGLVHRIADKMIPPVVIIDGVVAMIQKNPRMDKKTIQPLTDQVMDQIKIITTLLDQLLKSPEKKS